jgi:dihydrofolate reductase
MAVSLDGYIVGPDGGFQWTTPDEDVFRYSLEELPGVGVYLLGRRLYETMLFWETADQDGWDAWTCRCCRTSRTSGTDSSGTPANLQGSQVGLVPPAAGPQPVPVSDG